MYDNRAHYRGATHCKYFATMTQTDCQRQGQGTGKFDLSLDSEGYGRIEKISFEAYNESICLIEAIERFKEHWIRLSGSKLGRPIATANVDKKQEYQNNTNRIEVERTFSLVKRS